MIKTVRSISLSPDCGAPVVGFDQGIILKSVLQNSISNINLKFASNIPQPAVSGRGAVVVTS